MQAQNTNPKPTPQDRQAAFDAAVKASAAWEAAEVETYDLGQAAAAAWRRLCRSISSCKGRGATMTEWEHYLKHGIKLTKEQRAEIDAVDDAFRAVGLPGYAAFMARALQLDGNVALIEYTEKGEDHVER